MMTVAKLPKLARLLRIRDSVYGDQLLRSTVSVHHVVLGQCGTDCTPQNVSMDCCAQQV